MFAESGELLLEMISSKTEKFYLQYPKPTILY